MKFLTAVREQQRYYFQVHLDESKNKNDGTPDPSYVRSYEWGLIPPNGQTEEQYLDNIKREIGLLVDSELSQLNPPDPESTPLEGF